MPSPLQTGVPLVLFLTLAENSYHLFTAADIRQATCHSHKRDQCVSASHLHSNYTRQTVVLESMEILLGKYVQGVCILQVRKTYEEHTNIRISYQCHENGLSRGKGGWTLFRHTDIRLFLSRGQTTSLYNHSFHSLERTSLKNYPWYLVRFDYQDNVSNGLLCKVCNSLIEHACPVTRSGNDILLNVISVR